MMGAVGPHKGHSETVCSVDGEDGSNSIVANLANGTFCMYKCTVTEVFCTNKFGDFFATMLVWKGFFLFF